MHHDGLRILPATGRPQTDTSSSHARNSRGAWSLDRVLDLVVAPLDRERVCEMRGERLDAEPLGRVVAGGDQVDAELLRGGEVRLLGLAGEERVEALVGGADQVVAGGTGRDGEAPDPLGAVGEDERLAVESVGDARRQLLDREAVERAARGRSCRTAPPASRRSARRAARRCRASRARRARGGRRGARRSRGRGPRAGRAAAGRRRAARCARRARDGRAPSRRRRRPRARRARASSRRRRAAASPRRLRPPAGRAARTPASARPRAARSRRRRSRPCRPRAQSRGLARVAEHSAAAERVPCGRSGCGAAW